MSCRRVSEPCMALWASVVQQALEDVDYEQLHSVIWNQACAFFVDGGTWAEGRQNIADILGVHPDEIERAGRRTINARLLKEGLPPLQPRPAVSRTPKRRVPEPVAVPKPRLVMPRLVAVPGPEPEPIRRHQPGSWRKRWAFNPFDPHRQLPSEERAAAARLAAAAQRRAAEVFDADARDADVPHLKRVGGGAR